MERGELGRVVKLKNIGRLWRLNVDCLEDIGGKNALTQRLCVLVTPMLPSSAMVAYGSLIEMAVGNTFKHDDNRWKSMLIHTNNPILFDLFTENCCYYFFINSSALLLVSPTASNFFFFCTQKKVKLSILLSTISQ